MRTFWTTADLLQRGKSERAIRRAAQHGALEPVRKGLYTTPGTSDVLLRAARAGGVATSVSAAAVAGLWVPPDLPPGRRYVFPYRPEQGRLHVAARRTTTRFHDPDDPARPLLPRADVVLHRTPREIVDGAVPFGVTPTIVMLEHCFRSLEPDRAFAVLESALHLRFLRRTELAALAGHLPAHLRPLVLGADGVADSGVESIAVHLLRLAGLRLVQHAVLDGIGEVDLLIEGRLIVELDGRQFHDDEEAFARDRNRDLAATASRYRTLRFTWRQVLFDWRTVEAGVFAALAA